METLELLERQYPGRRAELKRIILQKALFCFNEQGIEASTIEMIRSACDSSIGAIYHHFGNKDGLVAALFFAALDDQAKLRVQYLEDAQTMEQAVHALVYSYIDWVDSYPELAKFQFAARFSVARGPHEQQLNERNKMRNRQLFLQLGNLIQTQKQNDLPAELLPSLIIGPAENYSRAWLSGRVINSPRSYRIQLAETAWRSISK